MHFDELPYYTTAAAISETHKVVFACFYPHSHVRILCDVCHVSVGVCDALYMLILTCLLQVKVT